MKKKNTKYFLTRLIGKPIRFLLFYVNPLNLIENVFIKRLDNTKKTPPIFIIGAPRSGTTLLYQLLAYHYNTSYITNFSSVFIKSPVIISYLTRKLFAPYNDNSLSSNYGLMKGTWAPSEAGKIFKYWFQKKDGTKIKSSIFKMSEIFDAPFIAKNLRINSELDYMHKLFPNAIFIHIERDLAFNAQSLILGIEDNNIDIIGNITDNEQRSIITKGTKEQVFKQVVDDINRINNSISSYLNSTDANMISINYNALCNNYESELNKIEARLNKDSVLLKRKNESFDLAIKASQKIKLLKKDWVLLKQITEKQI